MQDLEEGEGLCREQQGIEGCAEDGWERVGGERAGNEAGCVDEAGTPGEEVSGIIGEKVTACQAGGP